MQALRLATTRDKTLSPDYPLSILLGRGFITQVQHDAGMQYARNYWAIFGQPFAKSQNYEQGGGGSGMTEGSEKRIRADYEAAREALGKVGSIVLIEKLAVYLERGWIVGDLLKGRMIYQRHRRRFQLIQTGLDALAAVLPARREAA